MNNQQESKWYGLVSLQDGKLYLWAVVFEKEKPAPKNYKYWLPAYDEKKQEMQVSDSFNTEGEAEDWCSSFLPMHEKTYYGVPLNSERRCLKNVKRRLMRIIDECGAQIEHYKREIEKADAYRKEVEKELEGYCKFLNEKIKEDL